MVEGKSFGLRSSQKVVDKTLKYIDINLSVLEETILEDDEALDYNLVGSWYFMKMARHGIERWLNA